MKKLFSVLVAVLLCLCLVVPSALAADGLDSLAGALDGVDISSLSDSELSSILDGLDLEGVDLDSLKDKLGSVVGEGGGSDKLSGLTDALSGLASASVPAEGSAATGGDSALSNLSGMLGGVDMSWLPDVVSDPSAIASMFSGAASTGSGLDLGGLEDMIGGVFGGSGLDLSSLTSGIDLGSFDITSLLGGMDLSALTGGLGGGAASGVSDMVAGLADGLKGGLASMGIDTSFLDGLMDNDIVNFFANLFIGLGDVINGGDISSLGSMFGGGDSSSSSSGSDYSGGYTDGATTPNTGDTSAVLVAIGTISVAAAAAFVCLMKKE